MIERLRSLLDVKRHDPGVTELIYVYLPEDLDPVERHARYERMLDAELQLHALGYVSGGGTLLGDEDGSGDRDVLFCGVDVDTNDVTAARTLLREQLPSLGCPPGTQLHYRESDLPLQDEYDGAEWRLALPRTMLHPGFGL